MATGVVFGRPPSLLLQPGSYTLVDASALAFSAPFAWNLVCVIGAATGGEPLRLYALTDPYQAVTLFGPDCPLTTGVRLAFRGGNQGGAPVVLAMRVDYAEQARAVLPPAHGGCGLEAVFKDYGAYGNTYTLSFYPGTTSGYMAVLEGRLLDGREYRQTIDNVESFSRLVRRINAEMPVSLRVTSGGAQASQTIQMATNQTDGRATLVDERGVTRTNQLYLYQYPASLLNNSTSSLLGTYQGTWRFPATVNTTTNTLTAPGHSFVADTAVTVSGTAIGNLTAGTVYYVRDVSGADFKLAATPGGAALDLDGTFTDVVVTLRLTNVTISASVPTDFNGTYTVTQQRAEEEQTLAKVQVTATAYGADVYRWYLLTGTWQHSVGRGQIGSIFTIASGPRAGTYQILEFEWDGLSADRTRTVRKLSGSYAQGEGVSENLTITYWPYFQLPKAQPGSTSRSTQLPGNGQLPRGGHYLTVVVGPDEEPATVYLSTEAGDTIQGIAQRLTSLINEDPLASRYVSASFTYNSSTYTATLTLTAQEYGIEPNLYRVQAITNVQNELLVTTGGPRLQGGQDPPPPMDASGNIIGHLVFQNGFDSAPTYQRWLQAIEAIKYAHVRYLVPLTDNLGVQAAFADHAELASSTPKRRERLVILGHGLGWSLEKVIQRAEFFNSERVVFVTPGIQTDDGLTGNLRMYPSFYTAAQVAGMLAAEGNGITDPITHSFLRNVNKLERYYHAGSPELDRLIQAGALVIERDPPLTRPSQGFRVVRGITTWRTSRVQGLKSNIFEDISHINQSDYVAQRIRQLTEDLFVGRPLLPEVLEEIRYTVNLELMRLSHNKIIFGYLEKSTRVSINQTNQTAIDLYYEIMLAPAINFILGTQMLIPIPALQAAAGDPESRLPRDIG